VQKVYLSCVFAALLGLVGDALAQPAGEILFEYWYNIPGTAIADLTGNARYPNNPDEAEKRKIFDGAVDRVDNYGTRVRGYVYPPANGAYTFWISGDDFCQLFLSTDDDPAKKAMIAQVPGWSNHLEWAKYPEQKSSPITLVAGKKYYIEALMKEGGGGDNLTVAWGGPTIGAGPVVIAGQYLSPFLRPIDFQASAPTPANGAVYTDTWASLGWTAGLGAVTHDLYLGENADSVAAGTADTFRGNQTSAFFLLGLGMPGDPYPAGLVPGTTYYWRVDEVEADGATKHQGPVWSFFIPPRKAYAPSPRDDGKYVDTAPTLKWSGGLNSKLHYVNFGDNLDTVTNATGGTPLGTLSFTPAGPLAKGKTYYWRVDEFDGAARYKGDLWSFTTLPDIPVTDPNLVAWYRFEAGEGTKIIDFSGHNNHGTIVPGTAGTVQWVEGQFNLGLRFLGDDKGHVDMPPRIVTTARGSVAMWVNTNQTDDEGMLWYGTETGGDGYGGENEIHLNIDDPGQVDFYLEGTTDININGPFINGTGWTHLAATWDPTDGVKLYVNGAQVGSAAHNNTVVNLAVIRLGRPVATGNGNRYYEGLMDDVRLFNRAISAAKVSEIMSKGEDPLRAGAVNPSSGALTPVNRATPLSWSAGEKASQHDVYFGTDRDAVTKASVSDTTGIYRGRQAATSYTPPEGVQLASGPYYWRIDEINTDGTVTTGGVWNFSVANYALVEDFESYNDIAVGQPGSNLVYTTWLDGFGTTTNGSTMGYPTGSSLETANVHGGGKAVPLIFNNATASFSEVERTLAAQNWTSYGIQTLSLWFRGASTNVPGQLYVKINGVKVPYDGDAGNLKKPIWQPWNITLASIGTNLQSFTKLAIGIETKGTSGTLLLDDIRLYALPRQLVTPVQPDPTGLAARYAFEGNVNDSASGHNGTANGGPTYALGKIGQAISLDGIDDYVAVNSVGITGDAPRTISGWAKMNVATGIPDWTNVFGFSATGSNNLHFDIEVVGSGATTAGYYGIHVYGWEQNILPPDLEWHHFAATYDGTTISWYGDGLLVGSAAHPGLNTQGDVRIGKRIDTGGFFPGLVDEVQIYSRVLSEAEVAGLAGMTLPFDKSL